MRAIALPVIFLTSAMIALAADQSSTSEPSEFDIEPPILKQNLSDELAEIGTPDGDVAHADRGLASEVHSHVVHAHRPHQRRGGRSQVLIAGTQLLPVGRREPVEWLEVFLRKDYGPVWK